MSSMKRFAGPWSKWFKSIGRVRPAQRSPFRPCLEALEDRLAPATFTVTDTTDADPGSLRQAIISSNATAGPNVIDFNIGAAGVVETINLASALPAIVNNAVTIDGASEPGFNSSTGLPLIVLNGSEVGSDGLDVDVPNCTIMGLAIDNFGGSGINVLANASGTTVADNYLGLDATGTIPEGNGTGLTVQSGSNTIGGTNGAATRNLICGNDDGIDIDAGSGNVVEGNGVGTNTTGALDGGNGNVGVVVDEGATDTVIGFARAGVGSANIIEANSEDGIDIFGSQTTVAGNKIGGETHESGVGSPNGGTGVFLQGASNCTIGTTAEPNFIEFNEAGGVVDSGGTGNTITGNTISSNTHPHSLVDGVLLTDGAISGGVNGNTIDGNSGNGVEVDDASFASGAGIVDNTISFSSENGIYVHNGANGILVQGNTIINNDGQGVYLLRNGSTGNQLLGNFIGTDSAGDTGVGNHGNGVEINNAPGNAIGGTATGAGNVIAANHQSGIFITGAGASGNLVYGNFIGTNAVGVVNLGNTQQGVFISSAPDNSIGRPGGQNVISENDANGVLIAGAAAGNTVADDLIGTDITGSLRLPNTGDGVEISAAPSNTLTGDVISGNGANGVVITGGFAHGNVVSSSFIGTDETGTFDVDSNGGKLGNTGFGVEISNAPGNTIGGQGASNVISGNGSSGVVITGPSASANTVEANSIGTDISGTAALANTGNGVLLEGPSNTVQGNTISGNTQDGVEIAGTHAGSNIVQGNTIGADASGSVSLANGNYGVLIESASNTLGGAAGGDGNLISGNSAGGVLLSGPLASHNTLSGNYIGTDATGGVAIGNGTGRDGVDIINAPNNSIGGTTAGAGNVISGNSDGLELLGAAAHGNLLEQNNIGTDAGGENALPNRIGILDEAPGNTIGSSISGAGNVVSGNTNDGIDLSPAASGTVIAGNLIGTDATGTSKLANGGNGVEISGAVGVTVGGTAAGAGNVISGNSEDGIALDVGASGAVIQGSLIGTDITGSAALGNGNVGVAILNSKSNTIGGGAAGAGNTISDNEEAGIQLQGANSNLVQGNIIQTNEEQGVKESCSDCSYVGQSLRDRNYSIGNGLRGISTIRRRIQVVTRYALSANHRRQLIVSAR